MHDGTKGTLGLAALALLASTGCVIHGTGRGTLHASGGVHVRQHAHGSIRYAVYDTGGPQAVVVRVPPPAPRAAVATRPARPATGAVWVEGHWHWNGTRWVWEAGRWVTAPGAGYVWVPPRTVRMGGSIQFFPGHWRRGRPAVRARPAPSAVPAPSRAPRPGRGVPSAVPAPSRAPRPGRGVPSAVPAPSRAPRPGRGVPSAVPAPSGASHGHGVGVSVRGGVSVHVGPRGEGHAPRGTAVTTPGPRAAGTVRGTAVTTPGPRAAGTVHGTAVTTVGPARCRLAVPRVPPGGLVRMTLTGVPSQGSPVVRLGGRILPVVASRRRGARLDVQARVRRAASGPLDVRVGSVSVRCGLLEVMGR